MATTKTRINISISSDVERAVVALAKRDQVPHATKAAELLRTALEIEEDVALNAIAKERERRKGRYIAHKFAWR